MKKSKQYAQRVQNQFGGFCVRVLKNESANIDREFNLKRTHEKSIEELSGAELLQLSKGDNYFKNERTFTVLGEKILINDEVLAEAIKQLDEEKRSIILLSYFAGMSDREIGEKTNTIRQTISKRRKNSLKALKKTLLKEGYRW